jgi:hypothetical protein
MVNLQFAIRNFQFAALGGGRVQPPVPGNGGRARTSLLKLKIENEKLRSFVKQLSQFQFDIFNLFADRLRSDLRREAWRAAFTIPALAGALPARVLVSIIAFARHYITARGG